MTALAAVVALALPSPTVPGGPGPPGTSVLAAPADALRDDQAAQTAVGLEELPRALGHVAASPVVAAGTEEASLAAWAARVKGQEVVVGGHRCYRLDPDQPVSIPLAAWTALDRQWCLLYLGDQGDFVIVQHSPAGVRLMDGRSAAARVVSDLNQSIAIGREPDPSAYPEPRQLVLTSASGYVSRTHLDIRLDGGAGRSPVVVLRDVSTNGTYLRVDQVDAMLRALQTGGASTKLSAGPPTALGTGLEEGTGEDVRFAIVTDDDPLAEVLRETMARWGLAHTLRNPGAVILVPRIKLSDLWKSRDRPPDVVLVGAQVSSDDVIAQMALLALRLDHVTQRLKGTGAQVGVVFVAPEILHPTLQSLLRHRLDEQRLHSALVTPSLPRPPFREDRGDLGLTGLVYGLANAALDRRRGGLPEGQGRIFNPKTREFTMLTAALETGGFVRVRGSSLWQWEEAVRRRVLAMDAAQLKALEEAVRAVATSEADSRTQHTVMAELQQLRTNAAPAGGPSTEALGTGLEEPLAQQYVDLARRLIKRERPEVQIDWDLSYARHVAAGQVQRRFEDALYETYWSAEVPEVRSRGVILSTAVQPGILGLASVLQQRGVAVAVVEPDIGHRRMLRQFLLHVRVVGTVEEAKQALIGYDPAPTFLELTHGTIQDAVARLRQEGFLLIPDEVVGPILELAARERTFVQAYERYYQ